MPNFNNYPTEFAVKMLFLIQQTLNTRVVKVNKTYWSHKILIKFEKITCPWLTAL